MGITLQGCTKPKRRDQIFSQYLWVFRLEIAPCNISGTWNFKIKSLYLENPFTPRYYIYFWSQILIVAANNTMTSR
jgi:hypothetical protein